MQGRVIDTGLLPADGPPRAAPLKMAAPAVRAEPDLPAVPVTTAEEAVLEPGLPAVVDPVGRSAWLDERLLTEAMFFRLGFARATDSEMAAVMMASVLWVSAVMAREGWVKAAYDSGYAARDREGVVLADRALDRLVEGYVQDQQKVTKDGEVKDFKETVGPNASAVQFKLTSRARERYGKDARGEVGKISVGVMVSINERLAAAGEQLTQITVTETQGGGR